MYFFPTFFGHQNRGSGLDPDPDSHEMLYPDPYPDSMKPDTALIGCKLNGCAEKGRGRLKK